MTLDPESKQRPLERPRFTGVPLERQRALAERERVKQSIIREHGFSNAAAESFLDRAGYPRPPGWHAVLFYPGSYQPRSSSIVTAIVVLLAIGTLLR
jgi:hypothetical protein